MSRRRPRSRLHPLVGSGGKREAIVGRRRSGLRREGVRMRWGGDRWWVLLVLLRGPSDMRTAGGGERGKLVDVDARGRKGTRDDGVRLGLCPANNTVTAMKRRRRSAASHTNRKRIE